MTRSPEEALCAAVLDGLASEYLSITEKAAHVAEAVDDWREHLASGGTITKGTGMNYHQDVIRGLAKKVVEYGVSPVFQKSAYKKAIDARVEEVYGVTRAQGDKVYPSAFTKTITEDPIGKTLYAAMKRAGGSEVEVDDQVQDYLPARPPSKGPNSDAMDRLAEIHRKEHPEKSYAQAYNHVFNADENRALQARVFAEGIGATPAMPEAREVSVPRERPASRSYGASIGRISEHR